jgi:four helix bundle suffix protein
MPSSKDTVFFESGSYQNLKSFQVARLVYDLTVLFCGHFLDKRSRTVDQMTQAARSGVQNIAEGSMAAATSRKTEMKLTNVARASLEELKLDYEDFLRQRNFLIWPVNDPRVRRVRQAKLTSMGDYRRFISDFSDSSDFSGSPKPERGANIIISLIDQSCFLLDRQLDRQSRRFEADGGFTENLHHSRSAQRLSRHG